MNSFKMFLLAGVLAMPFAGLAQAADAEPDMPIAADPSMTGFYLRGDIGWSWLDWSGGDNDSAFVGSTGIGYQFSDMLRADLTGTWAGQYDVASGDDISTTVVMANAYFDFNNETMFTPYVGAGAGYGWVDGSGAVGDDDGFALGLHAGVAIDLTSNLAIDTGYHLRSIMTGGDDTVEHQVTTGLRFSF